MKGISYLTNDKNERHSVVIDLKLFKQHSEQIEDLLDTIIAEARKEEESIPFEKVIRKINKKQYNKEIAEAEKQIAKGKFTTQEDLEKEDTGR